MKRAKFTPIAEADLGDIAYFITRDDPERATSFVEEIIAHCHEVAAQPGVGRDRLELGQGVRSIPHGQYTIFYRIADDGIEVVRVLHGARDIDALFEGAQ